MKHIIKIFLSIFILQGCSTHQNMAYLNDSQMELNMKRCEKMELNFMLYREGSSGANGAKSGGGCGCN